MLRGTRGRRDRRLDGAFDNADIHGMNGMDWMLLALLGIAVVQGFLHGFIRELAGLLAWVVGIWAGIHLNDRMAGWLGLDPAQEALSFLVTFLLVLLAVHLLGRALTTAIDAAQLSLPNKVAGMAFALVRKAFVLSVLINLFAAWQTPRWSALREALDASVVAAPLRAFAPMVVPALGEAKWVGLTLERLEQELEERP
jgi:membrane protein required for colicin V production